MSKAEKNHQIKQITKELLERLQSQRIEHAGAEFELEQQSRHESDSSSLADEKEIHNKLSQILHLIGDDGSRDELGEDLVRNEDEFSRRIVEDALEGNTDEDLAMYAIAADELAEEDLDVEAEMQKLAYEYFHCGEEEKESEQDEEEIKFQARAAEIREMAKRFVPSKLSGDYRCPNAGYYGGFTYTDAALLKRLRSAATEIVKMVGKKLFSGSTDLTKISFPIKCMAPISTLEIMPTLQSTMVVYLNKAASISDPLERMKLVMAHNLSFFYKEKIFEKPLNPILGETF